MRRRGGVLILALVVLTGVISMLAVLAANRDLAMRATFRRIENLRARQMAQAGVERAMAELATLETTAVVNQQGTWYELGNLGSEEFLVGQDSFRMQITDAASLVNLNTADENMLASLGLTTEQIDSLQDWREAGETPRAEGAKDEYYISLPEPYLASKRRLQSFDELLLIKGFTPAGLFEPATDAISTTYVTERDEVTLYDLVNVDSYSPNQTADGNNKASINQSSVQQLTQNGINQQIAAAIVARRNALGGQFANMGQVLQTPGLDNNSAGIIVDNFTVDASPRLEGRLNLNTATLEALTSIPDITADVANGIISRQSTGFQSLSELFQVPGFTLQMLIDHVDKFAVGSDTFLVNCVGQAGNSRYSITAVIRVIEGTPRVLKRYVCPDEDMRARWGWEEEATSQIDLGAIE